MSKKALRTELELCILKAGPKFQRAEPNIKGVVLYTSQYYYIDSQETCEAMVTGLNANFIYSGLAQDHLLVTQQNIFLQPDSCYVTPIKVN